ncbi:MAG: tandem-95 repeat protein [Bacteroidetes bacterium]|nr:tandem-95 repeat protein [Bacteroidota bacterium]
MKKFYLAFLLFVCASIGFAQVITPFTIRYQTTQKGGIRYISNTAVSCNGGGGCNTARAENPPAGTGTDNGFTAAYVDIDGDGTTFQSSSDSLDLATCSEVLWAGLYWGAENRSGGSNYATRNQCRIKVNSGTYTNLTADAFQDNTVGFNTYHCFKDITTLVQGAGIKSRFTVANVAARVGGTNRFGGWSIVVVYKNDLQPMRNLTVFNGLSNVSGGNPTTDVTVSGFLTPLSGPITFEIGNITYDGDRSSTGDQLRFNGGSGFVNISDADNNTNDIFNSTLCYNGVAKTAPFINPGYLNTLGYDADIFIPNNVAKNYIGNSATSATLRLTTGGETFLTQVVSMAIDVYEPDLRAAVTVSDLNGGAVQPGDILEYTIIAKNIGSDPSVNTFVTDTLESNAIYVPGSLQITSGPNLGVKTDALADDQGEYDAATRTIKVRIGTGANGVTGGQVNNSPSGIDSTQIKFRVTATTDCVYLLCDNIINNRAYIFGTGNVSGNTFSNGSNPGIFDAFGCPIPGTTATPINAATCAAPSASSNSPVCEGSIINLSTVTSSSATYAWTGPNGFTSSVQNPSIASSTTAAAGTYTCVINIPGITCSFTVTTTVAVTARPATPTATVNTPVCTGGTINLSTAAVAGSTYSWTGPNSFTSTSQNPSITNATTAMAGTYSVTVTNTASGCTSIAGASATLVVNTTPTAPTAGSNTPVCTSNTINLTSNTIAGATYSWTGPSAFASALEDPTRGPATAVMAGTYSVTATVSGCTSAFGTTAVVVNTTPTAPTAGSNSPVCTGNTINLTSNTIAGATYAWTGPSAFASALEDPTRGPATAVMAGTYSVTATVSGCTSAFGTTAVVVNTTPTAPTAGSNTPVCTSNTINLTSNTIAGATYSWTGPSAFASALEDPTRGPATAVMAGTYSVTATVSGCTSAFGTTAVVVNTTPTAPTAGSNSPVCTGNTINLTSNTIAGATYAWTGPSAFASALEDPTRGPATAVMAGTYSVTATVSGCTSAFGTTAVVVNTTPTAPTAGSNTPVCTGNTINLTSNTIAGATYSWTGPSAFASALEDPTRGPATAFMGGTYSVTATVSGCTSAFGTTAVVVNTTPTAPTAGSNTPVCTSNTINLTSNTIAGATYAWTGPSAFASALEDPTRGPATAVMAGTYSVTATVSGCTSAFGTTAVVVNTTPTAPTAGSNTPVCTGNTINLTSNTIAGATYSWTGPSAFASALEDPTRGPATAVMAGTYSVTATVSGCTSAFGTTAVVVNTTPTAPTAGSNTPVCTGNTINLTSNTIAGATYSWTGPSAFASALEDPTRGPATAVMAGTYSVTATVSGCTSAFGTTAVVVNTTPTAPTAGSNTPVCTGNTINLTSNTIAGATYSWTGPSAFASALEDPTRGPATAVMAGTYSVTATVSGCTSAFGTTAVVVNTTPTAPTAGSNTPVCTGNTINLTSNTIAGATYAWTGPSAFASALEDPTRPTATLAMGGTYSVTATVSGCTSAFGTVAVTVSNPPATPTAGSNSPVCTGNTINLTANTIAGATYSWTGPSAFVSALEDPTRPSATTLMAGTYSVTATIGTCTSPAGTVVVAINTTPTAPTAGSNSPVCLTYPINLTANTIAGATYSWTGPSTFVSALEDPIRPTATTLMAGTYSVTATVSGCASSAGTVVVSTVNCTPVANPDLITVNEDTPTTLTVLANDTDPQSNINTSSVTITLNPTHGVATVGAGGVINYTPTTNYYGIDTLIYQVCDATAPTPFCDTALVILNVTPANDAPVAGPVTGTTVMNTPVGINVGASCSDPENDPLSYTYNTTSLPVGTTVTTTGNGSIVVTPPTGFTGTISIPYTVCDLSIYPVTVLCDNEVVTINVVDTTGGVNVAPIANNDAVVTPPNTTVTINPLANDFDLNGNTLTVTIPVAGQPTNGTYVINPDGTITYTPNNGFIGQDTITYAICDNGTPSLCDTANIVITISPVLDQPNAAPIAVDDYTSTAEDNPVTVAVKNNDSDPNGGILGTPTILNNPNNGVAVVNPNGTITYTPNPNFNGQDTLTYVVCDNGAPSVCDTANVIISVNPSNDAPVAGPVTGTTVINTPVGVNVGASCSDPENDPLSYTYNTTSLPVGTTVTTTGNGSIVVTPPTGFTGTISIPYTVCDLSIYPVTVLCDNEVVTINVVDTTGGVNVAPIANNDAVVTPPNTTVTINPLANDFDLNGNTLTVTIPVAGQPTTEHM